jgi:hypothetical protein
LARKHDAVVHANTVIRPRADPNVGDMVSVSRRGVPNAKLVTLARPQCHEPISPQLAIELELAPSIVVV